MRKVFIDDLPKKQGIGANTNRLVIDWCNSIGYKVKFIYDDIEGWIKIINYNKNTKKLIVKYNNNKYNIVTDLFKNGNIGRILGTITSEFKIELGTTFKDDKRDITIAAKTKIQSQTGQWYKYYQYTCNKCGFDSGKHWSLIDKKYKDEYWVEESSLLEKSTGCACCCFSPRVVLENINSIYNTDKWMIPIINDEEFCKTHTHSSNEKVQVTCPDCGKIKNNLMSVNHLYNRNSIGCSCSDSISFPNKFAYELLNQLNDIYNFEYLEHEYSPSWIGQKRYDNYFTYNGKDYIIEMDGGFHEKDNTMSGQTKEESKSIDDEKDRLAIENEINIIRINCNYNNMSRFKYIKENISNNKKLNKLFDLNKIDFDKCNKYALSNLVKIACDYKKNNPDLTCTEIGKIIGYEEQTIRKWLKQGGWNMV